MSRAIILFLSMLAAIVEPNLAAAGSVSVTVVSATVKDKPVSKAEVIFQKAGQNSSSYLTDSRGEAKAALPFGDDDNVHLILKLAGYSTLVVKCPCNGLTYAMSETMTQLDGMRIVLSWGARPLDLDAHLVYKNNHVYFAHRDAESTQLDVDNRQGYGPETITIDRKIPGERYLYAVHGYYDEVNPPSYVSPAMVQVYVGSSLIKTFYFTPPSAGSMRLLFELDALGTIRPLDQTISAYGEQEAAKVLAVALGRPIKEESLAALTSNDKQRAIDLNKKGEGAYHQGDLESAISYYREAIDLYGDYGQAFSNLGLAYQKSGRVAEAIWANRKAISLANGTGAETVRASSYYNIARIYESQNKWSDALRNFQYANNNRPLPVYAAAIDRMKQQLNAAH